MTPNITVVYQHADLVHLPIRYDQPLVQQLFHDISRKLYGGYQNLTFNAGRIEMVTGYATGGSSRMQLLPDRFRIVEQNSGISFDDFKSRFEVAMASAANVFGIGEFPVQNVKIRTAGQPILWQDAMEFLSQKVCGFDQDDINAFGRAPNAFTMNFSFLATPEEPNTYSVKIEALGQPQNTVWMDVDSAYSGMISVSEMEKGAENIQKTYDFIGQRTMAFLDRFDSQSEA